MTHRTSRLGLVAHIALLSGFGLLASGCGEPAEATTQDGDRPLPVRTHTVELSDSYETTRAYPGLVRSGRAAALSFELGGAVIAVVVDDGDLVAAGQVVARLDTRGLVAERRRLVAKRNQVAARAELADKTFARVDELAEATYATPQQLDEAAFNRQSARAQLRELDAAISAVDVKLSQSQLVAPFAGVVTTRLIDEGTVVRPGQPVCQMLGSGASEAVFGVPPSDLTQLEVNSEATIEVAGERLQATIAGHVLDVDRTTRTVAVVVELPKKTTWVDGTLVRLIVERRVQDRGAWVPISAIERGPRGLFRALGVRDQVVVAEAVEVLHTDGERAYVRGTLDDGEAIIAAGLHRVVVGQRVIVEDR